MNLSRFHLLLLLGPGLASGQVLKLPERPADAPSGSEFARRAASLPLSQREREIVRQIRNGNVPDFLRRLCRVQITGPDKSNTVTLFVTPDYLAVGSEEDYLLIPMTPASAQTLADALDCTLPTPKIVDNIHAAADLKLAPAPIPPSRAMTTVPVFSNHNSQVRSQRFGVVARHPLGVLVSGHKKDVVLSAGLASAPGKVAIYGWHNTNGIPIQPLYLGHSSSWVDYSQCIRMIQQKALLNGKSTTVAELLTNPSLAHLLSDEGVIPTPRYPTNVAVPNAP